MDANFSELIAADGAFGDGFVPAIKGALGADYAETKFFDDKPNLVSLAKAALDTRQANTQLTEQLKSALQPPAENASDQDKAAYRTKLQEALGAGESAQDYLFAKPQDWPQGLTYSEEAAKTWADFLYSRGVPVEVARDLVTAVQNEAIKEHNEKMAAQKKAFDDGVNAIRQANQPEAIKELGRCVCSFIDAYGSDDANNNGQVVKGLKSLTKEANIFDTPADFDKWLSLGIDPDQFLLLARIGKDMQAGRQRGGSATSSAGANLDADFINAVSAKSPGMQVPS